MSNPCTRGKDELVRCVSEREFIFGQGIVTVTFIVLFAAIVLSLRRYLINNLISFFAVIFDIFPLLILIMV